MTDNALDSFSGTQVGFFHNAASWRARGAAELAPSLISESAAAAARAEISAWPGYRESPLTPLPGLAKAIGIGELHYKDEGGRFGLGSFKALGGAYAVLRHLIKHLEASHGLSGLDGAALSSGRHAELTKALTVASATDGNHGRSVAWGARLFGCRCVIYIHAGVSAGREAALRAQGAEVVRTAGNYDESVHRCAEDAAANGWTVVSDTSWEGYFDIPRDVMTGYSVLVSEMIEQLGRRAPTHVFVQGGVGGIAATVADLLARAWGQNRPRFVVVEPDLAACLFASAQVGGPKAVDIEEETLMAGLSCGEVSLLAWDLLSVAADDFMDGGRGVGIAGHGSSRQAAFRRRAHRGRRVGGCGFGRITCRQSNV